VKRREIGLPPHSTSSKAAARRPVSEARDWPLWARGVPASPPRPVPSTGCRSSLPSNAATEWHQDEAFVESRLPPDTLHFWIPLQDVSAAQGCCITHPPATGSACCLITAHERWMAARH
jgi:hypothetical protein